MLVIWKCRNMRDEAYGDNSQLEQDQLICVARFDGSIMW